MGKQNGKQVLNNIDEDVLAQIPDDYDKSLLTTVRFGDFDDFIDVRDEIRNTVESGNEVISSLDKALGEQNDSNKRIDDEFARHIAEKWCDYKTNTIRMYGECFANAKDVELYRKICTASGQTSLIKDTRDNLFLADSNGLLINSEMLSDMKDFVNTAQNRSKELLDKNVNMSCIMTYRADDGSTRTFMSVTPYVSMDVAKRAFKQDLYSFKYLLEEDAQVGFYDISERDGHLGCVEMNEVGGVYGTRYMTFSDNGKTVSVDKDEIFNEVDFRKYCGMRDFRKEQVHDKGHDAKVDESMNLLKDMNQYDANDISLDVSSLV